MNSYNSLLNPPKGRPRQFLLANVFGEYYTGMWYGDHFELVNCPELQRKRTLIGRFTAWMELEDNPEKLSSHLPKGFTPASKHPNHNNEIILKIGPYDYCIGRWNEEEGKYIGNWFPEDTALWSHVRGWMEIPPAPPVLM